MALNGTPPPGGVDRRRPYFFIHVMKTAGSSFRQHITDNFDAAATYPDPALGWDILALYGNIPHLLGMSAEEHRGIEVYAGHFPFVVTELLHRDLVTMTILREPVARTISYLKHAKRSEERHHDRVLEDIYEDLHVFPGLVWNHQSKIFSMTADDPLQQITDVIEVDDRRLALAKENLEKVDVVGVTEQYGEFLGEVEHRFGWTIAPHANRNVGQSDAVPDSLRRQIAEDNEADLELYEFACELRRRRGAPGGR